MASLAADSTGPAAAGAVDSAAAAAAKEAAAAAAAKEEAAALARLPKAERLRRRAVAEVLSTERSYVADLTTLAEEVMLPLSCHLSARDLRRVFSNALAVQRLNKRLLQMLEAEFAAAGGAAKARVGKVLFEFAPFLKIYLTFVGAFDGAQAHLEQLARGDPKVAAAVARCAASPRCRGL